MNADAVWRARVAIDSARMAEGRHRLPGMLMFADIAEGLLTENERLTRERDAAYAYEDELLRKVEAAEAANERLTRERDEALDNALQVRNWAEAANEPLRAALRAAAADSPAARAALAEGVDRFLGDTAA